MASSHRDEISRLELLHAAHPEGLVFPHLADAYRRAGRYSQAEGVLAAGLRLHSDYSSAHVVLGRLRLDQGRREEARRAFHEGLRLDPDNHVALQYLGEMAAGDGEYAEAIRFFRAVDRLKPGAGAGQRIDALNRRMQGGSSSRRSGEAVGQRSGGGSSNGGVEPGTEAGDGDTNWSNARPEPGEVLTETMAELYARQGLVTRAAAVYRELLARNPGDTRLRAKLDELRRQFGAARAAEQPPASGAQGGPGAAGADPAAAGAVAGEPAEIRGYLRSVLRWRHDMPSADLEPWAHAPASSSSGDLTKPAPAADRTEPPPAPRRSFPGGSVVEGSERPPDQVATLIAVADLLVGLLEFRDVFFRGSTSLTRLLSTSIAEELGVGPDQTNHLALAAILRDLGRLAMGGRLVPPGRNTESLDARRRIERHVELGMRLLEGIALPPEVRAAVRHHHERWDGAGYPDALAREDIPLLARILAVADSFAAMVSPRMYRVPLKLPDAEKELRQESGTRYDPGVVDALSRVLRRRDQPHLGFVQRHRILLVDADQPGAVVTAAKLCSVGYLAEVATDLEAARERLSRVPIAALMLSAPSANQEAAQLIRFVRSDPTFAALPVVVANADGVAWRVHLLEIGADVCFPPAVSHAELQATVGAMVRRSLNMRTVDRGGQAATAGSPWLALQGDVQDFPLTWLLQVMKYDSRTAAIAVRTEDQEGTIYLRQGDAVHAELRDGARGESALRTMLQWGKGRFTVRPDARSSDETIESSIMHLLLMQAVNEDHAAAGIFGAVSTGG